MNYEQKHPILQKLEEYLKNTPKEQLDEDWLDILKNSDMEAYYEKKYKDALERAKKLQETCDSTAVVGWCEYLFPELAESEDERIRKGLIKAVSFMLKGGVLKDTDVTREEALAWLEKQKDYIKLPDSTYTSNRDVIEFADKYSHTVWEKLMDNFKKIENYSIGCNDVSDLVLNAIINTYNWLEKRCEKTQFDYEHADIPQKDFAPIPQSVDFTNITNINS